MNTDWNFTFSNDQRNKRNNDVTPLKIIHTVREIFRGGGSWNAEGEGFGSLGDCTPGTNYYYDGDKLFPIDEILEKVIKVRN